MDIYIQKSAGQTGTVGQRHFYGHIVPPGIHTGLRQFVGQNIGDLFIHGQFALVKQNTNCCCGEGFGNGICILAGICLGTNKCFNLAIIQNLGIPNDLKGLLFHKVRKIVHKLAHMISSCFGCI